MERMGDRALRLLALVAVVAAITLHAGAAHATSDSLWDQQWGPKQIHADEAWAAGATGAGVKVGVVDTGIDFNHPELAGKVAASAKCLNGPCADGAGLAQDDEDHGTHVSGIIAARANNGVGIAGVAHDAQLVVAKALDNTGGGSTADIAAGIRWVVAQGARVVNLSLGPETNVVEQALFGGGPSDLRSAIEDAWSAGAVPVLASGNSSTGLPIVSGSNNYGTLHAIVVGATDQSGALACYSSPVGNATWGIVAPGGGQTCGGDGIVSTTRTGDGRTGYAKMSGTSMATPHVSAVVAMLLGLGLDKQAAVDTILRTADKTVSCGSTCAGRLDAARAVASLRPGPTAPPTVPVTPQQPAPQQPAPQQPAPQQPAPQQPGLRPAPEQPLPAPQPSVQPAPEPQPQPSPQPVAPEPQPIAPQPINLMPAPDQPPALPLDPPPPAATFESNTTPTLPPSPDRAEAAFSETTTTTSTPPSTTTTVAPEPRHAAAPATSRALYQNKSAGGSTAAAIAAVSLLFGSAVAGLALTRRRPPPDLL
jgi:subtilisin family serine protease